MTVPNTLKRAAMRYSIAQLVMAATRRLLGQRRPAPPQHRIPTVRLNLERLEDRTPATSLAFFGDPLNFVEGAPMSSPFALASMTDSDGNTSPSLYSVSINWGDGSSPTPAYLFWNGNSFQIMGAHTYAEPGFYNLGITVNDSDGSQAFFMLTAHVSDAALSNPNGALNLSATAGQLFTLPVGFFMDADLGGVSGDFTATINWGDGSATSAGTIASNGGGGGSPSFLVNGTHTYAPGGPYNYTVNIQDAGGSTLTEQGTFNVGAGSGGGGGGSSGGLSGSGTSFGAIEGGLAPYTSSGFGGVDAVLHAVEGAAMNGVTTTRFSSADPNAVVADFSAVVTWGDGSSSAGAVSAATGGGFVVTGSHTYLEEGPYTLTTKVTDVGASLFTTGAAKVIVADAPLTASANDFTAATGAAASVNIATFTDADPNGAALDYQATIAWGDGASSWRASSSLRWHRCGVGWPPTSTN